MYKFFRDHPSAQSSELMAADQEASCASEGNRYSQSGADVDISYALLLADRQWGSGGDIDYHGEARRTINAILSKEVDVRHSYMLIGDWVSPNTPLGNASRSCDFAPGQLRSFERTAMQEAWGEVRDRSYKMVALLQSKSAPTTGLLPDFIIDAGGAAKAAPPSFLEGSHDGDFSYHASSFPWRLGIDAVVHGDERAKGALRKVNTWIRDSAGDDPREIRPGYTLKGDPLSSGDLLDMAFVAPLGAAAMTDAVNQGWLNDIWTLVRDDAGGDPYSDTTKVLGMITMSGNWWAPETVPCAP